MTKFISLLCIILISLLTINAAPVPGAEQEPHSQAEALQILFDNTVSEEARDSVPRLRLPDIGDNAVLDGSSEIKSEAEVPDSGLASEGDDSTTFDDNLIVPTETEEVVPEAVLTNSFEEPEVENVTITEVINTVYQEVPAIADSNAVTSVFTSTRFVDEVTTTTVFCNPIPTTTITEQGTITELITSSVVNEVMLTTTLLVPTTSTTFITSASTETSTTSSTFTVTSISCETETVKVPATKTVVKTKTAFATKFVTVTEDNAASSTVHITVTKTATHTQDIFVTETVDGVDDSVEEQTPCDPTETESAPTPPCDEEEPEVVNVDPPTTGYTTPEEPIGADPSAESVPGYTTGEEPEIVNTDVSTGYTTPGDAEVVIATEEPEYTTDPEIVDTDVATGYETPEIASADPPTGYEVEDPEVATEYTTPKETHVAEVPGYTILEEPDASAESTPEYTTEETLGDAYQTGNDETGETDGTSEIVAAETEPEKSAEGSGASNTTSTENHDPLAQALGALIG